MTTFTSSTLSWGFNLPIINGAAVANAKTTLSKGHVVNITQKNKKKAKAPEKTAIGFAPTPTPTPAPVVPVAPTVQTAPKNDAKGKKRGTTGTPTATPLPETHPLYRVSDTLLIAQWYDDGMRSASARITSSTVMKAGSGVWLGFVKIRTFNTKTGIDDITLTMDGTKHEYGELTGPRGMKYTLRLPSNEKERNSLVKHVAETEKMIADGRTSAASSTSSPRTPRGPRAASTPGVRDPRIPANGTVLTRNYKGKDIVVKVLADGFEWNKTVYSSLSKIGSEATGTSVNGYVFFNLK